MKRKTVITTIIHVAIVSFFIAQPVFAIAELPGNTGLRDERLLDFISSLVRVVLGLIGSILLLLILYGGFTYATAAGDEKKVAKGRQILTYAIIGVVIISMAWIVTDYLISNILLKR